MRIVETVADLREQVESARAGGATVGLVPTMGAFHEGHLSLMRRARSECGLVVASLFVNPSQFGAGEDLERYPRDLDRDAELARAEGVDVLFTPSFEEVYPPGFSTTVEVAGVGETLCGDPARRGPGHFRGVATVVTKLLNMCAPDVAYFGAKDFQQSVVIRRLVADLDIPVRIEVCPTVRDADGLALSSRNAYLSAREREDALSLKRGLDAARQRIDEGERDPGAVADAARAELSRPGVEPEYVEVVSARDLAALDRLEGEVLIAIAARVGSARLIDNVVVNLDTREAQASGRRVPMTQEGG
jgi:pantoate--beta-alanine ligase